MNNSGSFDIQRNVQLVIKRLRDHYFHEEKENLESFDILDFQQRAFSSITFLKIQTSRKVRQLVMKTTIHHLVNKKITDHANQAIFEYNILKYLYPMFQKVERCLIPRPILVVPEIEAYVMEFIEGHILLNNHRYTRYLSSQDGFDKLRKAYFYSGKWLKHFQEFTGIRTSDSNSLIEVINKCDHRLRKKSVITWGMEWRLKSRLVMI